MKTKQIRGWVIVDNKGKPDGDTFSEFESGAWTELIRTSGYRLLETQQPIIDLFLEDGYRCVRATLKIDQPKKGTP